MLFKQKQPIPVKKIALLLVKLNLQTEHPLMETATMLANFDFDACVGCDNFPCPTVVLALEIHCPIRLETELPVSQFLLAQYTTGIKFFDN